jgi:hypothetical protein
VKNFVDVRICSSSADVLGRISAATEQESLPFVSSTRYRQQRGKHFVSKVTGNKFRIWKVPSARGGQNPGLSYLSGEVSLVHGESKLKGSFALHPYNIVMALIPLAAAALVWLWGGRTAAEIIFITVVLGAEFILVETARRARPQEERDIVEFVLSLFPDARCSPSL